METKEPEEWTPQKEWAIRFREMALSFVSSKVAAAFILGMATEAFDVAISSLFGWPYHPAIDFVVWTFVGMAFLYWQKKYLIGSVVIAGEDESSVTDGSNN